MSAKMDGLIPFVLKALKKKKAMKHYRCLSLSSSDHLAHFDVTEPSPQGSLLFMTPQHPRAPRGHGGGGNIFMTPQHPRASRWLDDEGDGNGDPSAVAAVPVALAPPVARAKSSSTRRLLVMEPTPLTAGHERGLRYGASCHGGK